MVGGHCGSYDDGTNPIDMSRVMPLLHPGPKQGHIRGTGWIWITAADRDSTAAGEERQGAHPGTANSHEMNRARIGRVVQGHVGELI